MRILHLNYSDHIGGAARAANRLHRGLRAAGHKSMMFVQEKAGTDADVHRYVPRLGRWRLWQRRRRATAMYRDMARYKHTRGPGHEIFTDDRQGYGVGVIQQMPPADVLHLHWIARFLNLSYLIPRLPGHLPLVYTCHDMYPFTGGCHYDEGCGRFSDGCGACPQLGSSDPRDLSRQIWRRKSRAYRGLNGRPIRVVCPSQWAADQARKSPLFKGHEVVVIPTGLDTEQFKVMDRAHCRAMLGLSPTARIVFFVAERMDNTRKGFKYLMEALQQIRGLSDVLLMTAGTPDPTLKFPAPMMNLGLVMNDDRLAMAYNTADAFVMPSLQETQGQTTVEAIACGTPVVAFANGGAVEIIEPGVNGLIAPVGDAGALAKAIVEVLTQSPERRAEMSAQARRIAVERFGIRQCVDRYRDLYQSMLSR